MSIGIAPTAYESFNFCKSISLLLKNIASATNKLNILAGIPCSYSKFLLPSLSLSSVVGASRALYLNGAAALIGPCIN